MHGNCLLDQQNGYLSPISAVPVFLLALARHHGQSAARRLAECGHSCADAYVRASARVSARHRVGSRASYCALHVRPNALSVCTAHPAAAQRGIDLSYSILSVVSAMFTQLAHYGDKHMPCQMWL